MVEREERAAIVTSLEQHGISLEELVEASKQPGAEPFDVLCNVAYSAPLRTRRERAERLRREKKDFFERYTEPARQVLNDILEKYIEYGAAEFKIPEILKVPPDFRARGAEQLRGAVSEMQTLLYAP